MASRIINDLVREARVTVLLNARLDRAKGVARDGPRLTTLTLRDGRQFSAQTFIDATYEGDLMAAAGVPYMLGREANREFGETLNGLRFMEPERTAGIDPYVRAGDRTSGLLPRIESRPPGREGEAGPGVQSYNFRFCLTDVPANRVPIERPASYDPLQYELLLRSLRGQTPRPGPQLFTVTPMPNRKTDTNNRDLFSTDYTGGSLRWAEASDEEREQLWREHRDYTLGLLWFLAHDPRLPEITRREVGRWGLARDEFTATGNWPAQLYVREARRLRGEYVVTENDARRRTTVTDPVAFASYALDSHTIGMFVDEQGRLRIEGAFFETVRAFPISFRALLPRRSDAENLLVPVCLSATHAAYGSVRMEPVFFMLGQAAGTAAVLARDARVALHDLPYPKLKQRLVADGCVLVVPPTEPIGNRDTAARNQPVSPAALAALDVLQEKGFFAPNEASLKAWQSAIRPSAQTEAARTLALVTAAARRIDPNVKTTVDALRVLRARGATLDADAWLSLQAPEAMVKGEQVAAAVEQIAKVLP